MIKRKSIKYYKNKSSNKASLNLSDKFKLALELKHKNRIKNPLN